MARSILVSLQGSPSNLPSGRLFQRIVVTVTDGLNRKQTKYLDGKSEFTLRFDDVESGDGVVEVAAQDNLGGMLGNQITQSFNVPASDTEPTPTPTGTFFQPTAITVTVLP